MIEKIRETGLLKNEEVRWKSRRSAFIVQLLLSGSGLRSRKNCEYERNSLDRSPRVHSSGVGYPRNSVRFIFLHSGKILEKFGKFRKFLKLRAVQKCEILQILKNGRKKKQTSDSQNRAVRNAGCARMRLKLKQSENTIRACSNLSSDDMLD